MLLRVIFLLSFCIFSTTKSFATEPVIISERVDKKTQRTFQNLSYTPQKKPIFFCLSLPDNIPEEGLSCIIVMAGLAQGQKNLEYIKNLKNFAFIGYEYPSILRKEHKAIFNFYDIRKQTTHVPLDILDMVSFIKKQNWSNKEVAIAGFSFGAMFVPAIYHAAQEKDISLGPGVIAFAGADLYPLLKRILSGNKFTKTIKASIAASLFNPLEPAKHLPYLRNNFLIINGKYDEYIPFDQAKKLQNLTPEPKTIINLDTNHLSPTNQQQLKELNKICGKWFEEKLN